MTVPRIAVVGRQNVGKSTLANRLFGKRETIAHDDPGVTRDRVELEATWNGKRFGLVDTAGYLHRATGVDALAGLQSLRAIDEAQLVLLVVDVASGITEEDAQLAHRLRRAACPVLAVVNKVDTAEDEAEVPAFLALGLGDPIAVSSKHGRGVGELLDHIVDLLPDAPIVAAGDGEDREEPRFAIVGRPNVGKSSLFNSLVGEERSVVFEEAGTTRD
ncbi:MAG TPA: GTPase, partial [Actinomycetota bacterium]|nr:GTPase [Actinomycetota bacterium]